ncbi:MAG: GspH/FimT family pseudopilin [Gammaproteobacteria bacterium]
MEKNTQSHSGFSLIELVVTVAIAGILMAVAVPSMRDLMVNNRIAGYANEFLSGLQLARSEAVKRGTRVTMCRSSNGTSCAGSGNWQVGWVIFEDDNDDGAFAAADIIQVHEELADSISLAGAGQTGPYVSFIQNGSAQTTSGTAQSGSLTLTLDSKSRTITLTSVGRVSVSH